MTSTKIPNFAGLGYDALPEIMSDGTGPEGHASYPTPEGIEVRPVYGPEDLFNKFDPARLQTLPGFVPIGSVEKRANGVAVQLTKQPRRGTGRSRNGQDEWLGLLGIDSCCADT